MNAHFLTIKHTFKVFIKDRFCPAKQKKYVDQNHILFARNNIIIDAIEKLSYSPFDEMDYDFNDDNDIFKKNKEVALIYTIIIIFTITYIVIVDYTNSKKVRI